MDGSNELRDNADFNFSLIYKYWSINIHNQKPFKFVHCEIGNVKQAWDYELEALLSVHVTWVPSDVDTWSHGILSAHCSL